ncbi:hypothetical protein [Leptospira bouyouniensis]|uniref:Uncharacterized protein n=1 Tax=Leptospira bouyouniensis TaxID=2484911 RepID=A0ABY2L4Y1_9LEPT|nr:hypothetical protein [Leptospira bouyouniensis]TGK49165.1 hypothetical protein EHQ10_09725 [Leptospira bouyouniensis]TGM87461.1 hypothetical protein EHQ99_02910 [Leptospira bouyouniensis]
MPTKEDVILKTMELLQKGDIESFNKVLLSRKEHNEYFWPNIGERFHSDKGINADIAYDMMQAETQMRLKVLIAAYKGKEFSLENVKCSRPLEIYGPFELHLGCNLDVIFKDGKKIKETTINGVICTNNLCKLYHLKD